MLFRIHCIQNMDMKGIRNKHVFDLLRYIPPHYYLCYRHFSTINPEVQASASKVNQTLMQGITVTVIIRTNV